MKTDRNIRRWALDVRVAQAFVPVLLFGKRIRRPLQHFANAIVPGRIL